MSRPSGARAGTQERPVTRFASYCAGSRVSLSLARDTRAAQGCSSTFTRLNLVELGECAFELVVEQPHGVEDLAEGRRCSRPVGLAVGEDAVVAQIAHDRRVRDPVARQVSRIERRPGRAGNDLDQLEQLHLVDRVRQRPGDRRYLHEKIGMRIHEAVAHGDPVIESRIEIAEPRLLLVVARDQRGIEGRDRRLDGGPFPQAVATFGRTCLQASLVGVRASVPDVLLAVGLGEEEAEADAAGDVGPRRVEALGARDGRPQRNHVVERRARGLRAGGRCLHDLEQAQVLVDQGLGRGIEIGGRNAEFVGPADPRRKRVGEVLVGAHHRIAGEIERLPGQARQRLMRVDLRAPLAEDRLELAHRRVIARERGRLGRRQPGGLRPCCRHEVARTRADKGAPRRCQEEPKGKSRRKSCRTHGSSPSSRKTKSTKQRLLGLGAFSDGKPVSTFPENALSRPPADQRLPADSALFHSNPARPEPLPDRGWVRLPLFRPNLG